MPATLRPAEQLTTCLHEQHAGPRPSVHSVPPGVHGNRASVSHRAPRLRDVLMRSVPACSPSPTLVLAATRSPAPAGCVRGSALRNWLKHGQRPLRCATARWHASASPFDSRPVGPDFRRTSTSITMLPCLAGLHRAPALDCFQDAVCVLHEDSRLRACAAVQCSC